MRPGSGGVNGHIVATMRLGRKRRSCRIPQANARAIQIGGIDTTGWAHVVDGAWSIAVAEGHVAKAIVGHVGNSGNVCSAFLID